MSAPLFVAPPAKVLVTGANGFIAAWVVRALLDHNFSVRGTFRSLDKAEHLVKNVFSKEVAEGRFEVVVVPDITLPGAFDEAVKGVDAIEHTASPFHFKAEHPNELVDPAVKGTTGILESATKFAGPQLKRIVVTSSCAAVSNPDATGPHDESNWNEGNIVEIEEKVEKASQVGKYRASKSLAEKAAWKYHNDHKPSWSLTTLCPPFVYGPMLHLSRSSSPEDLNSSNALFYDALLSGKKTPEELEGVEGGWVDVRDVAEAHVRSIEVEKAGGERVIVLGGMFIWQDWFDAANKLGNPNVPKGKPGRGETFQYKLQYSNEKARSVLGINFKTKEECVRDTIADFKSRGW